MYSAEIACNLEVLSRALTLHSNEMRIPTLLQKINELAAKPEQRTAIDIDLMLDYTRVLYADLLEWRSRLPATVKATEAPKVSPAPPMPEHHEPTLAEIAEAMERKQATAIQEVPPHVIKNNQQQPTTTAPQPGSFSNQASINSTAPLGKTNLQGKEIRDLISINDKYQIMSELFGNDKNAYEQALDFINQSKNENTAIEWLKEQLWITEEHSDAAQSFFDIVARHFSSQK
jgi:hypothetical protein